MTSKVFMASFGALIVAMFSALLWANFGQAATQNAPLRAPVGTAFTYQGYLADGGGPANGLYNFEFELYDDAVAGTQAGSTLNLQDVNVEDGVFTVELDFGDVFDGTALWLEIGVKGPGEPGFTPLIPRHPLSAVPFAFYALKAKRAEQPANVIVVAKSGADFTSVQAAIDSISDAASDNPYLVWVAPGEYSEAVTMKPYVHLQGAGQEATIITSTSSNGSLPPTQATLVMTSDASLRDLTVENSGVGNRNVALLASGSVTQSTVTDVSVQVQGSGTYNYAIYIRGSGTDVKLQQVTGLSENGSSENYGLYNDDGAVTQIFGGFFTGRGGSYAYGINNSLNSTTLKATNVIALGEYGSLYIYGLYNFYGAVVKLLRGSTTGRGGSIAYGIMNSHPDSKLETENIATLGESGSTSSYGLINYNNAVATLSGGSFIGSGGSDAYGIFNDDFATLVTESVTALGENGSSVNLGLCNYYGAMATLRGGSFAADGGMNASGIYNNGSSSMLKATNTTAIGEGSSTNYGLDQDSGTVSLGVTQLVGGVNKLGGTLTCFQVYDGSFNSITCP
jgi:hypothetical protein